LQQQPTGKPRLPLLTQTTKPKTVLMHTKWGRGSCSQIK